MPDVCLYFQVHQPNRLIPYDFFRIGEHAFYDRSKRHEDDGYRLSLGVLTSSTNGGRA